MSRTLRVILTVTGSPVLLQTQLQALASFFPEGTRVTVVDDSRRRAHFSNSGEAHLPAQLRSIADDLRADYIRFPQHLHFHRRELFPGSRWRLARDASHRTADAIQFGVRETTVKADDIVVILDADMIPIAPFRPERYFADEAFWYLPQTRDTPEGPVLYPWNGIFFARGDLISGEDDFVWDCDVVARVALDTGGATRHWLDRHLSEGGAITGLHSGTWFWRRDAPDFVPQLHSFLDFDAETNSGMQFCEFFLDTFLHLRAGGNWHPGMRAQFDRRRSLFTEGLQALVAA